MMCMTVSAGGHVLLEELAGAQGIYGWRTNVFLRLAFNDRGFSDPSLAIIDR
jgi:hypothetical protein